MTKCFVKTCKSSDRKHEEGVTFHKIPMNRSKQWLRAIKRPINIIVNNQRICFLHFNENDFEKVRARKRVKAGVVPCKNLPMESPLASPLTSVVLPQHEVAPEFLTEEWVASLNEDEIQDSDVYMQAPPDQPSTSKGILCIPSHESSQKKPGRVKKVLFQVKQDSEEQKRGKPSSETSSSAASSLKRRKKLTALFHTYSLSPKHYQKQIRAEHNKALLYKRKLKTVARTSKRRKEKIEHLREVVQVLRKRHLVSTSALDHLESRIEGIPLEIMKRMLRNEKKGKVTREPYSPVLRNFSMTLQFYSQKAYEYVRKSFNLTLPAPSTIRSWLAKVNCAPGFSELSFRALKTKAREFHEKQQTIIKVPLMVALLLDEMAVKKYMEVERGTNTTYGYVDLGCGGEEMEPATEALVMMVVGVNENFKIPIAYFFINKLSGLEKANLVKQALHIINEKTDHIQVLSVTCDGPQVHFKMLESLGCELSNVTNLKTNFPHPATKSKVYAILDVAHMLKLIRNTWEKLRQIRDPAGKIVDWSYISKLHNLQESEGFYLANKLRRKHIEFRKQIMKVNLASQTLTQSVADALKFLNEEFNLTDFKGVEPTCNFIEIVSGVFDLLNSRNPFGRAYKTPLREANEFYWRPFLENSMDYLRNCTTVDGTPLISTRNKTGFLGFIISGTSLLKIYKDQVKDTSNLKYLLTYKFSQDHLELFFCSIRSRNGWINNPSCLEFSKTYKRLLMHNSSVDFEGNCIARDQTNTLTISTTNTPLETTDIHNNRKAEVAEDLSMMTIDTTDAITLPLELNEFTENVVAYIAGYVIKMIKRLHKCPLCIEALLVDENDSKEDSSLKFILFKSRGGLLLPSVSLRKICTAIEKKIKIIFLLNDNKLPSGDSMIKILLEEIPNFVLDTTLFRALDDHFYDTAVGETLHKKMLITLIIKCYAKIRLNSLAKTMNSQLMGQRIRTKFNRLIIFSHQQ